MLKKTILSKKFKGLVALKQVIISLSGLQGQYGTN